MSLARSLSRIRGSLKCIFMLAAVAALAILWCCNRVRVAKLESRIAREMQLQFRLTHELASQEIRLQQLRVRRRELELIAAKDAARPHLKAAALYRWTGVTGEVKSEDVLGRARQDPASGVTHRASADLFVLEFSLPVGIRSHITAIRAAELRLAREMAVLERVEQKLN